MKSIVEYPISEVNIRICPHMEHTVILMASKKDSNTELPLLFYIDYGL